VEAINFGVAGYGTAHELLTFRERARQYAPDVVLLAFFTGNDVSDNSRALAGSNVGPFFTLQGEQLVLDTSFRSSPAYQRRKAAEGSLSSHLEKSSRLLQVISQWRRVSNQEDRGLDEQGLYAQVYREPTDPAWQDAWRVTERLVATLHQEAAASGARMLLVTLSNPIQAHPDPEARRQFMQQAGIADLFYPDTRLKAAAERDGVPVLTLAPAIQQYAEQQKVNLHGQPRVGLGHWNAEGHQVAGRLMAERLCADLAN
jgi:hypothetical protein